MLCTTAGLVCVCDSCFQDLQIVLSYTLHQLLLYWNLSCTIVNRPLLQQPCGSPVKLFVPQQTN